MKKKHLVVGNWKMNPATAEEAKKIYSETKRAARELARTEVVLCPPAVFLGLFSAPEEAVFSLGTQDFSIEEGGAFTGEVGAAMAASAGASHAIIGHSERRLRGESDEAVAKKISIALRAGLKPIVCVGERERDKGGSYLAFLEGEVRSAFQKVSRRTLSSIIVAYEPIWAIGKSFKDAMSPSDLEETTIFIRKVLSEFYGKDDAFKMRIIYGGSVNFENAGEFISRGGVSGLLVGRESLSPKNFKKLLMAVDAIRL